MPDPQSVIRNPQSAILMSAQGLYIKSTKRKGRGVYCDRPILKDEIIEECPLLIIPGNEYDRFETTKLADYFFTFDKSANTQALVLGFGSIYNHKRLANANYWIDMEARTMTIDAAEYIDKHMEICINYGGSPGVEYKEWFSARSIAYQDA